MDDEWAKNYEFHTNRIENNKIRLRAARDELVQHITSAFSDVTRKGGVSLAEVESLDAGASEQVCKRIRAQQRDKHWSQVNLRLHDPYGSGLCFLDAIGFRYHVPAYMIDRLKVGNYVIDDCPPDDWMGQDAVLFRLCDTSQSGQESHRLLNSEQRACVAKLLAFEIELLTTIESDGVPDDCYAALKNYWLPHLPQKNKEHLESIWPNMFD